jgi:hypothetical protein
MKHYDEFAKPPSVHGYKREQNLSNSFDQAKPLSANRKQRNHQSLMEYGDSRDYAGGIGNLANLGNDTTQLKLQQQRKRNDFASSLEEQIRLKNERQRKEREQDDLYNYRPSQVAQPSSSHSRRKLNYQPIEDIPVDPQIKPRSRGNNMPGMDNR